MRVASKELVLPTLKEKLGDRIIDIWVKSPIRIFVEIAPASVTDMARVVFGELEARLQTATTVDTPAAFEILYHWAFDYVGCLVTVRTKVARSSPEIDSIAPIVKGAEWIEREMWELMGITFRNHPDMRHLLLMDDWPADKFPMRRDFRGLDA